MRTQAAVSAMSRSWRTCARAARPRRRQGRRQHQDRLPGPGRRARPGPGPGPGPGWEEGGLPPFLPPPKHSAKPAPNGTCPVGTHATFLCCPAGWIQNQNGQCVSPCRTRAADPKSLWACYHGYAPPTAANLAAWVPWAPFAVCANGAKPVYVGGNNLIWTNWKCPAPIENWCPAGMMRVGLRESGSTRPACRRRRNCNAPRDKSWVPPMCACPIRVGLAPRRSSRVTLMSGRPVAGAASRATPRRRPASAVVPIR